MNQQKRKYVLSIFRNPRQGIFDWEVIHKQTEMKLYRGYSLKTILRDDIGIHS